MAGEAFLSLYILSYHPFNFLVQAIKNIREKISPLKF